MRLSLKYPSERVALSWDFSPELGTDKAASVRVGIKLERSSIIKDEQPEKLLVGQAWIENGVVFHLIEGGLHGADYRVSAVVERADGLVFEKVSILPVRES